MRWEKSRWLRVHYMRWDQFRNGVAGGDKEPFFLGKFDMIWGGADLMLDLK